jgi:hypothetical protein
MESNQGWGHCGGFVMENQFREGRLLGVLHKNALDVGAAGMDMQNAEEDLRHYRQRAVAQQQRWRLQRVEAARQERGEFEVPLHNAGVDDFGFVAQSSTRLEEFLLAEMQHCLGKNT